MRLYVRTWELRFFVAFKNFLGTSKICNLICSLHVFALSVAPSQVVLVQGLPERGWAVTGRVETGFAGTVEYLLVCESKNNNHVVREHSSLCL